MSAAAQSNSNLLRMTLPRRRLLLQGAKALGGALVYGRGSQISSLAAAFSGDTAPATTEGLIWYSRQYLTAETPVDHLGSWITPTSVFFVRNNLLMPTVSLDSWRLRVTGEVFRPLEFTFRDLQLLTPGNVTNTLECAGNGRAFFQPSVGGVPWRRGAVGTTVFSGPPLRDLLYKAGPKATARHVAFKGLDVVPDGAHEFVRSIPIEKALEPNTLIALRMNGAALAPEHGFPARALVPGWIGSCSIKWLREIHVMKSEFPGFYMQSAYRLPQSNVAVNSGSEVKSNAITSLALKSIITSPLDGYTIRTARGGRVEIRGAAWAGEYAIAKVEVSSDGGQRWERATLGLEQSKYAWRLWSHDWQPIPGSYHLFARAIDNYGNCQPLRPVWNSSGYLWNGIDQVHVTIAPE